MQRDADCLQRSMANKHWPLTMRDLCQLRSRYIVHSSRCRCQTRSWWVVGAWWWW